MAKAKNETVEKMVKRQIVAGLPQEFPNLTLRKWGTYGLTLLPPGSRRVNLLVKQVGRPLDSGLWIQVAGGKVVILPQASGWGFIFDFAALDFEAKVAARIRRMYPSFPLGWLTAGL